MDVYQQLSAKIMVPNSQFVPKLFGMLATEDDADILLALPGTAQDLADRFDMEAGQMEEKLHGFFLKGLTFKSKKPEGTKHRLCRDIAQLHDASILWAEAPQAFLDLWQQFMEEEWPDYTKLIEGFLPRPLTRVIPVEQSISPRSRVLAFENVKEVVEGSRRLAICKCTCRLTAHKCDRPVETCLQIDKAADYALERGTGREVTKEEALTILTECEEAGLVHVTMNRSQNMHYICNCCGCCCMALPLMVAHGRKMCDPSRFLAVVEEAACTGCGICLDSCTFNALAFTENDDIPVVHEEVCMGCGVCKVACPTDAIALTETREETFVPAM